MENVERRKARNREYMRKKRIEAKALGIKLSGWDWHKKNRERNRAKTRKWKKNNPKGWQAIQKRSGAKRISTPWGRINNSMYAVIHKGLRSKSHKKNPGKYERALGYRLVDLKYHFEKQFSHGMTWDNWGEVWEVDHIIPCSTFHFTGLDDPLFKECWSLSNLRPLLTWRNRLKRNLRRK